MILDEIVKLVFAIVGTVITPLVAMGMYKLLQKWGIELTETKKAVVEQQIGNLVALTEEWASVKVKTGVSITAEDKAKYFLSQALDKIPGITADEATETAKVILGRFKVAAAGAVSDVRLAAGK